MEGWEAVRLPWFEAVAYSPAVEPGFEGVALWAPPKVSLASNAGRIPLFGTVRLGPQRLEALGVKDRHPLRAVVVGAIVARANNPYVGNALLQAPLFPAPPSGGVTEHFAVDLAECSGVPRKPGRLFVFASLGPYAARPLAVDLFP